MNPHRSVLSTALLLTLACSVAFSQDRAQRGGQNRQEHNQFDAHDQQVAHDWYNQHQKHPPAGLRSQDRLSPEEESKLREGAPLDPGLRGKVHPAPAELTRKLPAPPRNNRYVLLGQHVGQIDDNHVVKAVIHLH
ncbi:MAG: hypothetical protein M3N54_09215 [Acidobacteriota bacterium]|nr:hypothetical protein [Acidobacteriota bacterium]